MYNLARPSIALLFLASLSLSASALSSPSPSPSDYPLEPCHYSDYADQRVFPAPHCAVDLKPTEEPAMEGEVLYANDEEAFRGTRGREWTEADFDGKGFPEVDVEEEVYPDDGEAFVGKDGGPSLADVMTVHKGTSMFYDYVRSVSHVNERTMVGLQKTTFFAPSNPTILHLARKPHQGPSPADGDGTKVDVVKSEEDREKENFAYLDKWVSSHAVESFISWEDLVNSTSPSSSSATKWKNMVGKELEVECNLDEGDDDEIAARLEKGDTPEEIGVKGLKKDQRVWSLWRGCKVEGAEIVDRVEASNGMLYVISGTIPVEADD